jgi:CDP-diacylglycerol--glycerol-3-phosphate 3-phosphatidyltransferase
MNLPNLLTLSRIALTPLFLGMLFAESWYLRSSACVVFAIASLTDFYDGRLARSKHVETDFGRFMDPLADKILVTSALVALVWSRLVHVWLVAPIVVRDIVITAMRAHAAYRGRPLETTRLAKWKTMTQLVTVIIILFVAGLQETLGRFGSPTGTAPEWTWLPFLSNGLMGTVLVLTLLSGLHYFLPILRFSRRRFLP